MPGLDEITLLPFRLPPFRRISWVSRRAGEVWAPRFRAIEACRATLLPPALREGIYPLGLFHIYPHEQKKLLRQVSGTPLVGEILPVPAPALSSFYVRPFEDDGKRIFVLMGQPAAVEAAREAVAKDNLSAYHAAFGLPESCIWQLARTRDAGLADPFLPWAWGGEAIGGGQRLRTVDDSSTVNILLQRLGLNLLFHLPAGPGCSYSLDVGARLRETARSAGYHQEMDWLEEVLTWPVSWSVLHGIAEIKTPVMKAAMDSDPTAEKYEVQYHGHGFPDEGAQGVGAINAEKTLNAGFTTVRDLWGQFYSDIALRDAMNKGLIPGPRMYVSGPAITMTGGHGAWWVGLALILVVPCLITAQALYYNLEIFWPLANALWLLGV